MKTLIRLLAVAVFAVGLAAPAWPMGNRDGGRDAPTLTESQREQWAPVLALGHRAGLSPARLETTAAHLTRAGVTPDAAGPVLAPAYRAAREGLPAGTVLDKVDEGAAKGVGPAELAAAAEERGRVLRQADRLLAAADYRESGGVLVATALALEGGVPESALTTALEAGRGKAAGLVKATIEAGESLHLAGLDDATVAALMVDCLDRNLRRSEILRVVRFAAEKRSAGMTGPEVRAALWGGGASGGERGGGVGAPAGAAGAAGPGPGPARGGPGGFGGGAGPRPPRGGHR